MNLSLKWRVIAALGTGTALLVGGAISLRAQAAYPAPPKTPAAAATRFYQLLDTLSFGNQGRTDTFVSQDGISLGAISRTQFQSATAPGRAGHRYELLSLLLMLSHQRNEPQFDAQVTGTNGNQTFVAIAPSAKKSREVVVVPEDGGFRVDLKATLGRWNNLSGTALDEQWFLYTGEMSPGLESNPTFINARENARRSSCQSNLKQQMLGILQYSQDWDEKLPPARRWIDAVMPYIKSEQVFKCPSLSGDGFGYAFNQNLSQIPISAIQEPSRTVNIYETSNPSRNWFGRGTGRAYRHAGGSNLAFADGHIKWFLKGPEEGVTFKP